MITQEQETERAKQMVERFVRRFQPSYRLLAYHAALPLVLTPELLNFLRVQFLQGEVPWVAEVDLLLSDLCSQVGYELYAMDTAIRGYLLEEMQSSSLPHLGKERMQEVASLLISYVKYLSQSNPYISPKELETQQWAAMVYLGDEQCKAVARDIAERLIEVTSNASGELTESAIRAELARLAQITEQLSLQLQQQPTLLEYAKLVQQILRTPDQVETAQLNRSYQVENLELQPPDRLLPEKIRTVKSSQPKIANPPGISSLQTFDFKTATVFIEEETENTSEEKLQSFSFETVTVNLSGEIIKTEQKQAFYVVEKLGETEISQPQQSSNSEISQFSQQTQDSIELEATPEESPVLGIEMVAIPGGSFMMGAPKDEEGSRDKERPQHEVTVPSFFMGKYPVTQAQWKAVAKLPQVERELKEEPSRFKGDNRPVERVSWYDAVEFCARLSFHTGREYRLPSEAEWEYACRAGTTTPFHFGETITTDIANYRGKSSYGQGPKGVYREETTPVGSFEVANNFGLYDMHGNVLEWCLDDWHNSYENAPTDGSAWFDDNNNNLSQKKERTVLPGGSWRNNPDYCRSAYRSNSYRRDNIFNSVGFRVVCVSMNN